MKHQRQTNDELQELLAAYAEYVKLLEASEKTLLGMAHAQGYQTPEAVVQRGHELRQRIAAFRKQENLK